MNIASRHIPPIPVNASLSAQADCAGGWKWELLIFDKGPSGRRRHYLELNVEAAGRSEATG